MRRVYSLLPYICLIGMTFFGFPIFSFGQQPGHLLSIRFLDSLQVPPESYFLYPVLEISAAEGLKTSISVSIKAPNGWSVLGASNFTRERNVNNIDRIPFTLIRNRGASASWSKVMLQLKETAQGFCLDTFLLIRAPLINDFLLSTATQEFELDANQQQLQIPLLINNRGTTPGVYTFTIRNSSLGLQEFKSIRLQPGEDSSFVLGVKIPPKAMNEDQRFLIQAEDSMGYSRSIPVSFQRVFNEWTAHPSRYKTFPFGLELGFMLVDKQMFYYADSKAEFALRDGSLGISFRTKTFGPLHTIEKNVFTVNLKNSYWDVSLGQLAEIKHFYAYGRGVKAVYSNKKKSRYGFEGILHTDPRFHSNDHFNAFILHEHPHISFLHRVIWDHDKQKGLNGYLIYQEASFKFIKNCDLRLNLSAGFEEFSKVAVFSSSDPGIGLGYSYIGKIRFWDFQSTWQYHQKSYPGVDKGLRTHSHIVRWTSARQSVELSYQYNSTTSSLLLDTVYLTDAFYFNMEKTGLKWSRGTEQSSLSLGTGLYRQKGMTSGQLPRYQFSEVSYSVRLKDDRRLSLSSLSGFANNSTVNRFTWMTNSSFDFQIGRSGIKGFFVQQPVFKDSLVKQLMRYNRTILLSPYLSVKLFRKMTAAFRYSISRSLYDNRTTSAAGFNLFYRNSKGDWQLNATGSIPFSRSKAPGAAGFSFPYMNVSIKKNFSIPLFTKRKYHELSVQAFEDLNLNGAVEEGERLLPAIRMRINGKQFITNEAGRIVLNNTDTGRYTISVQPGSLYKELAPVERNISLSLKQSEQVLIPFRRGHFIFGRVETIMDSYSTIKFTPENILIRAMDSTGKQYSVLTDKQGEYSISLPAGKYTVSLNPDAFRGSIRPDQDSFSADLRIDSEQEINFKLRQRKREIRMRQQ